MLVQQDTTQFETIQIILETPEEANKFWGLIEYATCQAQENGLDFELGNKICSFFSSEAVVPNSKEPVKY